MDAQWKSSEYQGLNPVWNLIHKKSLTWEWGYPLQFPCTPYNQCCDMARSARRGYGRQLHVDRLAIATLQAGPRSDWRLCAPTAYFCANGVMDIGLRSKLSAGVG